MSETRMQPWEPFRELMPLREAINRLMEEGLVGPSRFDIFARRIPVDLRETDTDYLVEASLPGVKPEELEVSAAENAVTIRVTREEEKKAEEPGTYLRHERYAGEATRMIEFPGRIHPDKVTAAYEQGVLTLRIPKSEEAKRQRVSIQVKEAAQVH